MTTITVTFDPPLPSDSPATFNSKAFDTLGDLNTWSGQANTVAGEVNTNATNAATSAGTASTHASTATTKAGEANASAVAAAASASSASTSAGTATTKASEADASAIAAAASAASIAPGSLLTAANPSYTGTLTGGTGVVNLGSGQFVKDAAGNVGVGVTPSAWSGVKAMQIANSLSLWGNPGGGAYMNNNAYWDGSVRRYVFTGAATEFIQAAGGYIWNTAPSGTAGNPISFTQAMTLDASGALRVQEVGNSNGTMQLGGTTYYGTIKHDASSTGANIYNVASASGGGHIFQSGGTTQFMTDGSGNLLVGATSQYSGEKLGITQSANTTGQYIAMTNASLTSNAIVIAASRAATTAYSFLSCYANGVAQILIAGNGNVVNANNSYGAISDLKLKENITDASPKLAKLMQVRIVNYTLKADPDKTKLLGVIAQELEQISPGLIEEAPDYKEVKKTREVEVPAVDAVLDDEGNEVTPATKATTRTEEYTERVPTGTITKSVKYSVFVPMLIKGVQEQQAQIEAMQTQLDEQNTAMQMLATRLAALEAAAT